MHNRNTRLMNTINLIEHFCIRLYKPALVSFKEQDEEEEKKSQMKEMKLRVKQFHLTY